MPNEPIKKMLVAGYYGYSNAGDDAFADVACWGVRTYYPQAAARWTLQGSLPLPSGSLQGIYRRRVNCFWEWTETRRLDALLFAGGSNFHSSDYLEKWIRVLRRNRDCRAAAIGVSIGPFKDPRAEANCRDLLNRFSFIGVRDQKSYERLERLRIACPFEVTFDLAIQGRFLHDIPVIPAHERDRILGISLCYYERHVGENRDMEEKRLTCLVALIDEALASRMFDRVVLFSFNDHPVWGDNEILERLQAMGGYNQDRISLRRYDGNPVALMQSVGKLAVMIAMRLHAAVFAYTMGTPCLLIPYHEKCREWMSMIKEEKYLDVQDTSRRRGLSLLHEIMDQNTRGLLPVSFALEQSRRNWQSLDRNWQ